jgi:hypothetical protein
MYHYDFQTMSRDIQIIESKTFLSRKIYFKLFKNSHHYSSIDAKSNIICKIVDPLANRKLFIKFKHIKISKSLHFIGGLNFIIKTHIIIIIL